MPPYIPPRKPPPIAVPRNPPPPKPPARNPPPPKPPVRKPPPPKPRPPRWADASSRPADATSRTAAPNIDKHFMMASLHAQLHASIKVDQNPPPASLHFRRKTPLGCLVRWTVQGCSDRRAPDLS